MLQNAVVPAGMSAEPLFPVQDATLSCGRVDEFPRFPPRFTFGDLLQPVQIGHRCHRPHRNLLLAELSGVLCVPAERASEVLEVLRGIVSVGQALEQHIDRRAVLDWDNV